MPTTTTTTTLFFFSDAGRPAGREKPPRGHLVPRLRLPHGRCTPEGGVGRCYCQAGRGFQQGMVCMYTPCIYLVLAILCTVRKAIELLCAHSEAGGAHSQAGGGFQQGIYGYTCQTIYGTVNKSCVLCVR